MDFVSLETRKEMDSFLKLAEHYRDQRETYLLVGGEGEYNDGKPSKVWKWKNSGKEIKYQIAFHSDEPNNWYNDDEYCLSIHFNPYAFFNDLNCIKEKNPFVCQQKM